MAQRRFKFPAWLAPALFIAFAALLTWPWTIGVLMIAYNRDIKEKVEGLANRVKFQLAFKDDWTTPQQAMEPIIPELLSDKTVQAVWFFDYGRNVSGSIQRNKDVPVPKSEEDAKRLVTSDANSYRRFFYWAKRGEGVRGIIYIDLSRPELRNHFWETEGPLIRKLGALTCAAFLTVSGLGIWAYRLWGKTERKRMRAQLEQQGLLAERGLTAAVLAHEIRNPLQALRFQLHSLRRNAADPEKVASTGDLIDGELSRIQQLVQDYLAHEKAQTLHVQPVELNEAVATVQTLMVELLRSAGTRLSVSAPQKVVVTCDPHALRQILINLILNAQQAMGGGGAITITIGQADGFGTIAVKDTGPGIPEELREHLFKPFATSKKEGSGIGLALVKRFVDNFGGSVNVESSPGQGATFQLRLPLAGGEPSGLVLQYQRAVSA